MNACQNMIQTMMINEINRHVNGEDNNEEEEEEDEEPSQTIIFTPVKLVFRSFQSDDN
jgi:hypothetical protein